MHVNDRNASDNAVRTPRSEAGSSSSTSMEHETAAIDDHLAAEDADSAVIGSSVSTVTHFTHLNPYARASVIHAISEALVQRPARRAFIAARMPDFDEEVGHAERSRARTFPRLRMATDRLVADFHSDDPAAPPTKAGAARIRDFAEALADILALAEDEVEPLRVRATRRLNAINDRVPMSRNSLALMGLVLPDAPLFARRRVGLTDLLFALEVALENVPYVDPGVRHAMFGTTQYNAIEHRQPDLDMPRAPEDLLRASPSSLPFLRALTWLPEDDPENAHPAIMGRNRHRMGQWSDAVIRFRIQRRELGLDRMADGQAMPSSAARGFADTWREVFDRWAHQEREGMPLWPGARFEALSTLPAISDGLPAPGALTVVAHSLQHASSIAGLIREVPMLADDWMNAVRLPIEDVVRVLHLFDTLHRDNEMGNRWPPHNWVSVGIDDLAGAPALPDGIAPFSSIVDRLFYDPTVTLARARLLLQHATPINQIFGILSPLIPLDINDGGFGAAYTAAAHALAAQWRGRFPDVDPIDVQTWLFSPDVTDATIAGVLQQVSPIVRTESVLAATHQRLTAPPSVPMEPPAPLAAIAPDTMAGPSMSSTSNPSAGSSDAHGTARPWLTPLRRGAPTRRRGYPTQPSGPRSCKMPKISRDPE